ncbi:PH-interacting protein, partial [Tanacetum coccineum]
IFDRLCQNFRGYVLQTLLNTTDDLPNSSSENMRCWSVEGTCESSYRPSYVLYLPIWSSDDGSCRIWDARHSQFSPRIYIPKPREPQAGKRNGPSSSSFVPQSHHIFCCALNSNGIVFVTRSSDILARVAS